MRRSLKSVIAILLILFICQGMMVLTYANSDNPMIRVKFLFSSKIESRQVSSSKGLIFGYETDDGVFHELKRSSSSGRFTIAADTDTRFGVNVYDPNGDFLLYFDTTIGHFQTRSLNSEIIRLNDYYRGCFEFRRFSVDDMTIINILPLEDYLRGVVPKEIEAYLSKSTYDRYNSNSDMYQEALKAQAIAARTYAYTCIENPRYKEYDAHLSDEPDTQIYRGYAMYNNGSAVMVEQASTDKAIEDTKGELLKYNGRLAYTYYSASNGGYTESPENVWQNQVPYLKALPDPYEVKTSSRYYWQRTYTSDEIRQYIIKNSNKDIGNVLQVEIVSKSVSGRPVHLRITGDKDSIDLYKDKCRNYFAFYSQNYTVIDYTPLTGVSVISGNKEVTNRNPSTLMVLDGNGVMKEMSSTTILNSENHFDSLESTHENPTSFTFVGRGWGHGIGMSQEGAKGRALIGQTYKEILYFYYPGTYIE